jgi:hypothetical protein
MSKRIKSFLITLGSLLIPIIVVVLSSPEWLTFSNDIKGYLSEHGLSTSLIAVIGLVISELWKAFLNSRKAVKFGYYNGVAGAQRDGIDMY